MSRWGSGQWGVGSGEWGVELNTKITPQLKAEGEARELVRAIQVMRKKGGCGLDEEIVVELPSWPEEFKEYIKRKTLAKKLKNGKALKIIRA